jgi:hypothetical protein
MRLPDFIRAATSRVETLRVVRTAVNPLLWMTGIVTPLSLVLAVIANERWMRVALLSLGALPVAVTLAAYFVLLFRDPDRLQSEEYRLRQRALQMVYKKGAGAEIVDAATEIVRTERLPGGFGDGDQQ